MLRDALWGKSRTQSEKGEAPGRTKFPKGAKNQRLSARCIFQRKSCRLNNFLIVGAEDQLAAVDRFRPDELRKLIYGESLRNKSRLAYSLDGNMDSVRVS